VTVHSAAIGRLHGSYGYMEHDEFIRKLEEFGKVRSWIHDHDVRDDFRKAVTLLEKEGHFQNC
jgi:hypothetical protein